MSCCPFPRRVALAAVLVASLSGCPGGNNTPTSRPESPVPTKPAKPDGTTPRMTAPEHVPGG
jgi:hypothetical protein